MLASVAKMMIHGRAATAALGRHHLYAFPAGTPWKPSLRAVAKAANGGSFTIEEVPYNERVQQLAGPPKVQLRGRLETTPEEKTAPDGRDRYAEADMVVSYQKGKGWVEDRYILDIDGSVYDACKSHVRKGSWIAVEGELFLEALSRADGGLDQVAVVTVNSLKHSADWTPAFAKSEREAKSSSSPQPQPDPGMSAANVTAMAQQSPPPQQQQQPAASPPRGGSRSRPPAVQPPQQAQPQQQPIQVQTPAQQQQYSGARGYGAADYGGFGQPAAQQPSKASSPPADESSLAWLGEASSEDKWKHLSENKNMWWDNRTKKTNPKAPDFKLKAPKGSTLNVPLWLSSKDTPEWAKQKYAVDAP